MDLSLLAIFAEVVTRGNYAEVARNRSVRPSVISRAISTLEDELGLRLFNRSTRRVVPTEAGLAYFEHIQQILAGIEEANVVVSDYRDRPSGTLRITAPVTFGQIGIVPLLPPFLEKYPEISLDVSLTDTMVDVLAERMDVAVRLGKLPDSNLIAKKLYPMQYVVCASPAYLARRSEVRHPTDLIHHDCVALPLPGYCTRWVFRSVAGENIAVPIRSRVRLSNASAVRECAAAGLGVTLLPIWVASQSLALGQLVPLLEEFEVTPHDFEAAAWLVHPSRKHTPRKVRLFINFLIERYSQCPPWEQEIRQACSVA